MPRYLVERSFANGCSLPTPCGNPQTRLEFIENNSLEGVIWVHSYITPDRKKSYCVYEAPTPEALRRAANLNGLPVDRILEVSVLDAYFYTSGD
jgi:hypothetical protein